MAPTQKKYLNFQLYQRLLNEARPCWTHISGIFVLELLAAPLALLLPLPLKIVVDSGIGSDPLPGFIQPLIPDEMEFSQADVLIFGAILLAGIGLLSGLRSLLIWVLGTYTGEKLVLNFRSKIFRHIQRLSFTYHDTKGTGDSLYRIQYDTTSIQWIAVQGIVPFITSGITVASMIYVTSRIDGQLALVALAISPLLFFLTKNSCRRLREKWDECKIVEANAISVIQEVLSSVRVVKAFGREDQEQKRFVRHATEGMQKNIQLAFIEGGVDLFVGFTVAAGMAVVLYIGGLHVMSGIITLGELLVVVAYMAELFGPMQNISKKLTELQGAFASAERAFAVLDELPEVVEAPHAKPLQRASGSVAFKNVSFAYSKDCPVLHNVSFEIVPGTRVGVVGRTGAGKTTLLSLLTRFHDPSKGQVMLDGLDLREYRLADLCNQFALVLQEPVLFSTSITENIAYGRPDANMNDIKEAAKAANAHDFIERLPNGYDFQVGERGTMLSGGERQRISLARAFLKDAPILILDEPTSSVDNRTEAEIMEALDRLLEGRTSFIITHRLSTQKNLDVILQIDQGRLIEEDSAELNAVNVAAGESKILKKEGAS
jgi:ATP-binding cassette subfamily B protein